MYMYVYIFLYIGLISATELLLETLLDISEQ